MGNIYTENYLLLILNSKFSWYPAFYLAILYHTILCLVLGPIN